MSSPRVARIATAVTILATALGVAAPASAAGPVRPGPLTVSTVAQTSAVVTFGASPRATGYEVRANGRTVLSTRRTASVRIPLRCGRIYDITAVALDRRGRRSQASPGARLRTRACLDRTAPSAPARLTAPSRTSTSVSLAWPAATDAVGVTGYVVSRNGVVLGGALGRTFVANNLRPATSYDFSVRARDRAGNLSAPVTLRTSTAPPPPSTGDVRAFLLTTDDGSFRDAQQHYQQLDRVFPTFFTVTAGGDIIGTGQPRMTTWFQDRDVLVLPRFHTEDPTAIEAVVTDPDRRVRAAQQIATVVKAGGYDGASLDLEMNMPLNGINDLTMDERWDRLRNGYSDFVDEVAEQVHAVGGLVSVAVSPNWCSRTESSTREVHYCTDSSSTSTRRRRAHLFDYERLAAAADEVWVMAWGLHWATSEAGAVADIGWLSAVIDYYDDLFADQPAMIDKLTLGTNLYAMDWSQYVLRTERIQWPGTPIPPAPRCADSSRLARAVTHYEGEPGAGQLVIDWTCLTRYAATWEFDQIDPAEFTEHHFDPVTAENVLSAADPAYPGAQRFLWYVDRRTIDARAQLARDRGWSIGFWRLGREDQDIWTLPVLTGLTPGSAS